MLMQGSWLAENRAALIELLARAGRAAPADADDAPFAVFDWDQTVIRHDIGDALFQHQIGQLGFACDSEEFWTVLGVAAGDPLREKVARLLQEEPINRGRHNDHPAWREALLIGYLRSGELDPQEGFPWQTKLLAGLTVDEVRRLTRVAIDAESALPLARRQYQANGQAVEFYQGMRPYAEILDLIRNLEAAGIQAWVVSATNVWAVQTMAEHLGIRSDRVIGMRTRLVGGVLTAELDGPVPATWGKVQAIQHYIHPTRPPVLVAGDNITDLPMLEYSQDTRLVIDRGVRALREAAEARQAKGERWLIQPMFNVE